MDQGQQPFSIPASSLHALMEDALKMYHQGGSGYAAAPAAGQAQPQEQYPSSPAASSQSYDPSSVQSYAQQAVAQAFPNDPNAWDSFNRIVNQESGWQPTVHNKSSNAAGLMQFLSTTGVNYGLPADAATASPQDQVNAGIKYVQSRYGTPTQAWQFHLKNGWY